MGGIAIPPLVPGGRERGGPRDARGRDAAAAHAGDSSMSGAGPGGPSGSSSSCRSLDPEAVAVAATRARVVEFFYAEPDATLVDIVHAGGAIACWQIGSVEEAVAANTRGMRLHRRPGHGGGRTRPRAGRPSPAAERACSTPSSVPVVAAGGIGTARSVAAALAAGADGGPHRHALRRRRGVRRSSGLRRRARPRRGRRKPC